MSPTQKKNELVSYHKVSIKPRTGCLNAAVSVNRNNATNSSDVVGDLYMKKNYMVIRKKQLHCTMLITAMLHNVLCTQK